MRFEGFHGRAGLGERPALIVVDVNVGFTDPASPLVCDLDDVVDAIRRLLGEFRERGAARSSSRRSRSTPPPGRRRAVFIDKVPALLTLEAGSRWVEIDPRIAPLAERGGAREVLRLGVLRDARSRASSPRTAATRSS